MAATGTTSQPMLSPADIAERLNVPRQRVYLAIRTGELAATDIGAGRPYYRVSEDDLEAYLQRRYRPAR